MVYVLSFYTIGIVFALVVGWFEMSIEEKAGHDMHEAPAGLTAIGIFSWAYIIICLKRYIQYREKELTQK